jgi:TM2 domain-containing membrane protein YozV
MKGQIESYDPENKNGVIKSDDKTFTFQFENWTETVPPEAGDEVIFDSNDDTAAVNVRLLGIQLEKPKAVKYKYLALFLAIFLGWLGLHRLYLGYYRIALAQLALSAILIYAGFIVFAPQWAFVDALLIFSGSIDKDSKGRPLK